MKSRVFACAVLAVLLAVSLAGAPKSGELLIESDTMVYNKKTSEAVFTGRVRLYSGDVEVSCEKLVSMNYKDAAVATGKVSAYYRKNGVKMTCRRLEYSSGMSLIRGIGRVTAVKETDSGNTMTMKADLIVFNSKLDTIEASAADGGKIKVSFSDITAFAEKAFYDQKSQNLDLEGSPVAVRNRSVFASENIRLNTETKAMTMNKGNWAKVFYEDVNKK